jgi:spore photoproduct lyase
MKKITIKKIYVDEQVKDRSFTKKILSNLPNIEIEITRTAPQVSIAKGKQILYITNYKGDFCKPCPGTSQEYLCCNYQVINETTGCPLDCAYCILQGFLDSSVLTVYANYEKIFEEFDRFQRKNSRRIIRIGTGELADSIALEPFTNISSLLIPYFRNKKGVFFELKTKTDTIDFLKPFAHKADNLVLSWSLNTTQSIEQVEFNTASLDERLQAARRAQDMGFKLSFHFDPIIHHENWKRNYSYVLERLFSAVDHKKIVWISLGALRMPPDLKPLIKERFPETGIIRDEQIIAKDRKLRYFKPLRVEMFRHLYNTIRSYSADLFVYFCMEDKDVWQKVMGFSPQNTNHVDFLFAESLYKRFPEMPLPKPNFDYYQQLESIHDPLYEKEL